MYFPVSRRVQINFMLIDNKHIVFKLQIHVCKTLLDLHIRMQKHLTFRLNFCSVVNVTPVSVALGST